MNDSIPLLSRALFLAAALISSGEAAAHGSRGPTPTPQTSGTTFRLQAVSPVNEKQGWASGLGGTHPITPDGRNHPNAKRVPGADAPQFHDLHGANAKCAHPS